MAFKQNEDFLRFLTIGAVGCAATAQYFTDSLGHQMAELERYAMSNKVWATKVKRLRLPDLMCLRCGVRLEVRGKSKLAIRVSDSNAPARAWDAGLRDDDLFVFVRCETRTSGTIPHLPPQAFKVTAMRRALEFSRLGQPKAASEGAERDRTWPASVPSSNGEVVSGAVTAVMETGRRQTFRMRAVASHAYLSPGERFSAGDQFVVGCVPAEGDIGCTAARWAYLRDLDASSDVDRYAAVKAAGLLRDAAAVGGLSSIASAQEEDPRIRLEAAGSLARIQPEERPRFLAEVARGDAGEPWHAIEATFILSELATDSAAAVLTELASDTSLDSELRCAAVWGLGATGINRPDIVLRFTSDDDDFIAMHALAALGTLTGEVLKDAQHALAGTTRQAASAAKVLPRGGGDAVPLLLEALTWPGEAPHWALYALGQIPQALVEQHAIDEGVRTLLWPMWKGNHENWLTVGDNPMQLRLLDRQLVRGPF